MNASPPDQRPLFALLLRLAAAASLALLVALVKLGSESGIALPEILFWRQLPTVPLVLLFFWSQGRMADLKTDRLRQHGKRAVIGLMGMVLNFGAVTLLPLAEATTFNFTSAIWAVILSALILHEHIGIWRWSAVALGFGGVIIITQPGDGHIPVLGAAVALGAAFMIALISILIRDLSRTEQPLVIVFYFSLLSLPILGGALPFFWTEKTVEQWAILIGAGLVGLLGQFLLTAALRYGSVASVIVMDYSGLLWATLLGYALFEALPSTTTWLGAPLVVAAGLIIAWRENLVRKKVRPPATL